MFETHPYLQRENSENRSALFRADGKFKDEDIDANNNDTETTDDLRGLPNAPWLSEVSARKHLMGRITKRQLDGKLPLWWQHAQGKNKALEWPSVVRHGRYDESVAESWIRRFDRYLNENELAATYYQQVPLSEKNAKQQKVHEARTIQELANSYLADRRLPTGDVAFIYADGNNMGGYIRSKIVSAQRYQEFSQDIFKTTIESVYQALCTHLKPRCYKPDAGSSRYKKSEIWLYPFEIVAIGGDDVMLIVPADKALEVTATLCEEFEQRLRDLGYIQNDTYIPKEIHRYHADMLPSGQQQSELSMSAGVLITAQNTPFYYAEDLTNQLMKSAKKRAKKLRKNHYYGGTVDFLILRSVTMISSNVEQFRKEGLTVSHPDRPTLKQYAAPYTLHELRGLLKTAGVLKAADFPRSQLYQIRSLLERGKQTAMLNYRYFRLRLTNQLAQAELAEVFERGWCQPKDSNNNGNLAPWMSYKEKDPETKQDQTAYETLWRELVDLYPFVEKVSDSAAVPARKAQQ